MSPKVERSPSQPKVEGETGEHEVARMFRLSINDLVPDRAGEVVLFNDSALRSIVLEGVAAPIEEGITRSHRMADGVDVSGFRFIRVRDDLTIFFSPELQLVLSNS